MPIYRAIFKSRIIWCIQSLRNKNEKILSLALCLLSFNSFALGGYGSLTDAEKKALTVIVKQLGTSDSDNSIKKKIYDTSSFAFEGDWGSYWTGLAELSASKYKDGTEKGVIEIALNNSKNGTVFLTYIYKPEVSQIVVFSKQIRHGSKKLLLDTFEERKNDKEEYKLHHENDNYALLQEKGKVEFEFFHVSGDTGSLVYSQQIVIDL